LTMGFLSLVPLRPIRRRGPWLRGIAPNGTVVMRGVDV
jgi:hypothetical protein